jgi:hypothetical protein
MSVSFIKRKVRAKMLVYKPWHLLWSSLRAAKASFRLWFSHNNSSKTCFRESNTLCREKDTVSYAGFLQFRTKYCVLNPKLGD